MEENTQAEAPVVEEAPQEAQAPVGDTNAPTVDEQAVVEATQQTETAPQEAPAVVLPAPTYEEVQTATQERIAGIPARIAALVAIQGPAVLDMIEHHLLTLENVSKNI